ncbi:FAD-dependent oxidoreductase [Pseudoflavonifractor sp.]|jgi:fumarate reductase flavoprotein subunit|uniref:FAD-dependent oxidoreductase n=1 Tax=Pseudoflavonifractor sp. TaxID=1980281 RepID=UPI003D8E76A9
MNVKKLVSLLLSGAMVLSLAACSNPQTGESGTPAPSVSASPENTPAASAAYTAGTYTASAVGKNGDVTVEVVFSDTAIESVTVTEHQETAGLADPALERIPEAVVEGQTLAVDTVAGATITSEAILTAVADCVTQAGGDVAALQTPAESEGSGETVSYEADVVIVGAGAAGMNAAVEAAQSGLKVIVLEKGASIGVSNGAVAGGPSACETVIQEQEGQDVSVETLFNYMYDYSHSLSNAALLRNVLSVSGETINTMVELGVGIYLRPDNYGAGFRARHGFDVKGEERFAPLRAEVEANGGQFLLETTGEEVIMENGTAVGVLASQPGGVTVEVRAKAVLVCTGGYLGNEDMIHEHFGNVTVNPLGNTLSDGAGINMVVNAGGILDRNWSIIANEFTGSNQKAGAWNRNTQNLTYAVYGGLMVNREGERFFNEETIATMALSEGGEATLREGLYYSVIDQAYFDACREEGIYSYLGSPESWYVGKMTLADKVLDQNEAQLQEAIDQGWAWKADTIEELAEITGLEHLPETVAEYNAMCEAGKDTQFYKDPVFLTPVSEGPFYVFEYEPSAWGTLGGVKVDSHLRALTADNEPIPGLYVAGVDAGSMYTAPYYSNEGAALGLAMASGTWAAKEISSYVSGN